MSIRRGQYRHLIPLTADVGSANNTNFQDITGLLFTVASGIAYRWQATLIYTTSAATIGLRVSHTAPAFTINSYLTYTGLSVIGATNNNWFNSASATDTGTTSTSSLNTTGGNLIVATGILIPSAAGTFQMRFAPETATTNGIVIKAGSTLEWW